jgi:GntR family transcriptional repressor for pyruvate dehydrogenase complex
LEEFETSIKAGTQVAEDDIAFHLAILHATKNPLVIKIGKTMFQRFKSSISVSMKNIPQIALKDHKRIFEAFCGRDRSSEKLFSKVMSDGKGVYTENKQRRWVG